MKKAFRWFIDGITLKDINHKKLALLYILLYIVTLIGFISTAVLTVPTFMSFYHKGVLWKALLELSPSLVMLIAAFSALLYTIIGSIKRYRELCREPKEETTT